MAVSRWCWTALALVLTLHWTLGERVTIEQLRERLKTGLPCCKEGPNHVQFKQCPGTPHERFNCTNGRYVMETTDFILVNGTVKFKLHKSELNDPEETKFCVMTGRDGHLQAFNCFQSIEEMGPTPSYTTRIVLASISIICLILTLIVYMLVPELRDLQGKCLINLVICFTFGLLSLCLIQGVDMNATLCTTFGFALYIFMFTSFLWLNVVAINIWRSVRFPRVRLDHIFLFMMYNAYAWGVGILALIIVILVDTIEDMEVKPLIGKNACWFHEPEATWRFFYAPVLFLLILNILLFLDTAIQLWRNYKEITSSSKIRSLRYKCRLYFSLFIVMGVSWIFEPVSFLVLEPNESHWFWSLMDSINELQGVFIFLLMVVTRRRVHRGLARVEICGLRILPASWANMKPHDEECEDCMLPSEVEENQLDSVRNTIK